MREKIVRHVSPIVFVEMTCAMRYITLKYCGTHGKRNDLPVPVNLVESKPNAVLNN